MLLGRPGSPGRRRGAGPSDRGFDTSSARHRVRHDEIDGGLRGAADLVHVLGRVRRVLHDDGLVPGQRVEDGVEVHVRDGRVGLLGLNVVLLGALDPVGLRPLGHGVLGPFPTFVPRGQLAIVPEKIENVKRTGR